MSSAPRSSISETSTAAYDSAFTAKTLPEPLHAYSTAASAGPPNLPIDCAALARPTALGMASRRHELGDECLRRGPFEGLHAPQNE